MRDRLIEMLMQTETFLPIYEQEVRKVCEKKADHLLAEGVIVPPVKVGQTLYKVYMGEILEVKAISISYEPLPAFTYTIHFNSLGVLCLMSDGTRNEKYSWNIYITRAEAERALKEAQDDKQ